VAEAGASRFFLSFTHATFNLAASKRPLWFHHTWALAPASAMKAFLPLATSSFASSDESGAAERAHTRLQRPSHRTSRDARTEHRTKHRTRHRTNTVRTPYATYGAPPSGINPKSVRRTVRRATHGPSIVTNTVRDTVRPYATPYEHRTSTVRTPYAKYGAPPSGQMRKLYIRWVL
jgi:hypothetical protein